MLVYAPLANDPVRAATETAQKQMLGAAGLLVVAESIVQKDGADKP